MGDTSAAALSTQEEWYSKHKRMNTNPPTDGRDYLRHARSLLPLLEGICEVHPISKAVVSSFKAIINFENDRRENDARVTHIFLAQTDMMRVLLDLDSLNHRRGELFGYWVSPSDDLEELFNRISDKITSCGNSIDTYYKESKLVKFCKSSEWKERMLGYDQSFKDFRLSLQTRLHIQVASGVDDLNAKMGTLLELLNLLFAPRYEYERKLMLEMQDLGNPSRWNNNPKVIESLVLVSGEHTIDPAKFDPKSPKAHPIAPDTYSTGYPDNIKTMDWHKDFVDIVREELQTPLEKLCSNNKDLFQKKLDLHSRRMVDAINKSAQAIIRSLSGPYDRLENEDLRALWKEMNWIFCVENKLFTFALYEFFLDRVATFERNQPNQEDDPASTPLVSPRLDSAQKIRHAMHPDSWSLEYMSTLGSKISSAIDVDNSGYIRISEVNAFTDQIPQGWNVPQWCAYNAIGFSYETRIYQARMNQVFLRMCELQAETLPANRAYVLDQVARIIRVFFPLTCHIDGSEWQDPPNELRHLIKDKLVKQDKKSKADLTSIKFNIDAEATVYLLFENKAFESYLLPLVTLLLEHWLELVEVCSRKTLDIREWELVGKTATSVREAIISRIGALREQFKMERGPDSVTDALNTFYGGLYSNFHREFFLQVAEDEDKDLRYQDAAAYLNNLSLLDDLPLLPVTEECRPLLQYQSWEEFQETLSDAEKSEGAPPAWGHLDATAVDKTSWTEREVIPFPYQKVICDKCEKDPLEEARYHCMICDFDLCSSCYTRDGSGDHYMVKITLSVPMPLSRWLTRLAFMNRLEVIRHLHNKASKVTDQSDGSETSGPSCSNCRKEINVDGIFYYCVGHCCKDCYICPNCVDEEWPKSRTGHQSWHTLVVLEDIHNADDSKEAHGKDSNEMSPIVAAKIEEFETRMKSLENRVETGFTEMRGLFEQLLARMDKLPPAMNPLSPRIPTANGTMTCLIPGRAQPWNNECNAEGRAVAEVERQDDLDSDAELDEVTILVPGRWR